MRQGSAIYRADEATNPLGQQIANCELRILLLKQSSKQSKYSLLFEQSEWHMLID